MKLPMRVFVVQLSGAGDLSTIKIKMRPEEIGEEDIYVRDIESFLRRKFPNNLEVKGFEFYNEDSLRFESYHPEDTFNCNKKIVSVLAHVKSETSENVLQIQGRAFDVANGLSIAGHVLSIGEKANRSEGTGLNTWDGSIVLAKYLEKNPDIVRGKKVLEVGSGTGVSGMSAYFLGASLCVLTDLKYTLDNLKSNVDSNVARLSIDEAKDRTILALPLDWMDPHSYLTPRNAVDHYDACSAVERKSSYFGNTWDVILGADVVWLEELVVPLTNALRAHSSPETVVLLSHQKRSEYTDAALFLNLRKHFDVDLIDRAYYDENFQSEKINIYHCRLKMSS